MWYSNNVTSNQFSMLFIVLNTLNGLNTNFNLI